MKNIIAAAIVLVGIVFFASTWAYQANLQNGVRWTCDIVHEAYYKKSSELNEWRKACLELSSRIEFGSSKQEAVEILNEQLSQVATSHLSIYSPEKSGEMWDNKAIDNGLRVRSIDGAFIIYGIVPESPASEFEIKIGDEVTKVNEEPIRSAYKVRFQSGKFDIRRLAGNPQSGSNPVVGSRADDSKSDEVSKFEELEVVLLARELSENLEPSFTKLNSATGVLKIQSFLPQYFEKEKWLSITKELSSSSHVIVDLRENAGGSFVAMLRALSPFFCKPTSVGIISAKIEDGKNASEVKSSLADDLEARIQIDQIEAESSLLLKTFEDYGCSNAKVTVLVDADTASTGEIFAYAMSGRPNSRVLGVPTAGEVVVARWYDMSPLGYGCSNAKVTVLVDVVILLNYYLMAASIQLSSPRLALGRS